MQDPGRERRSVRARLALALLLVLGLAFSSPAHEALHGDHEEAHACVACELDALEPPRAEALPLAPPQAGRAPRLAPSEPVESAARPVHAPRGPPGSRA